MDGPVSVLALILEASGYVLDLFLRVKVTVHTGYIHGNSEKQIFVNVANLSTRRSVELGAAWIEGPRRIPILNPWRPLPETLRPGESWETWLPLAAAESVIASKLPYTARVRIAGGRVLRSRPNRSVPPAGTPPGRS